ncbi:MAG: FAD-dependent oxidoreductase, partial [Haliea sp.]
MRHGDPSTRLPASVLATGHRKAIVIGAGVVGCSTALALAGRGWDVTVVDAQAGPGHGTSRANGAQLSYSYVEPLATPATLGKIPSLLFSANSPLSLKLRADVHQWTWLAQFIMACNTARVQQTTRALLELAGLSRRTLDGWLDTWGWDCDYAMPGKLVLLPTAAALDAARPQLAFQANLGCTQELLTARQCVDIEPALAGYEASFAGGVWTADECVIDPLKLTHAMTRSLLAMGHTARFDTPVHSLVVRNGRVLGVNTPDGELLADAVVICAGANVNPLIAGHAPRLPIYPIKGYSVTLDLLDAAAAPRVSITDAKRKLVFARLGNR